MIITAIPLAVMRFQYQIARIPLQLIEDQLMARMASEAPVRLYYERTLGILDATVGHLLGDSQIASRGAALTARSDALIRAAQLDADASEKLVRADAVLKSKIVGAEKEQEQARAAKAEEVARARRAEEQRNREAAEEAQKRTATANKQADEVAARRIETVEATARDVRAEIRATERNAVASAKERLEYAEAQGIDAAETRAQADRIEELADVEKTKRQGGRAASVTEEGS